jgi:hypothetical protein
MRFDRSEAVRSEHSSAPYAIRDAVTGAEADSMHKHKRVLSVLIHNRPQLPNSPSERSRPDATRKLFRHFKYDQS